MDRSIRALVAVEGLDVFDVQRALPDDPSFELVGVADGVDETVRVLQEKDVDVVLVACQGREDDWSLQIIDGAHRTAPETPIVVLSTSSPNGFLRRAFEAGAADMALFPQSKEQLRFAMSKAITRAPRRGAAQGGERRDGRLVCVLGPKGGSGKTLQLATSVSRSRKPGRRCSSSISTSSSAMSGSAWACPRETFYDLALAGGHARRRTSSTPTS